MDLEEGPPADGSHGEVALRSVVAQARGLASGHEHEAHAALAQELLAALDGPAGSLLVLGIAGEGKDLGGLEGALPPALHRLRDQRADLAHLLQVDPRERVEQAAASRLVQGVESPRDVILPGGDEGLA